MKTMKLLWISLSLMILMACNKDNKNNYPKQITFSDYTFQGLGNCNWENLEENTPYIIHSEAALLPLLQCKGGLGQENINFEQNSLLVIACPMPYIRSVEKEFWKLSAHEYELNLHFTVDSFLFDQTRFIHLLVPKLSEQSTVKLNITKHYENEKPENPVNLLQTSWKLVGFVNGTTRNLTEAQPNDCEHCFALFFDSDTSFIGNAGVNKLWSHFHADYANSTIQITYFVSYLMVEVGHGEQFLTCLSKTHRFSATNKALKLYYNEDNDYLLFKPWNGTIK